MNVQQGDLAIVVNAGRTPEMIGCIVQVLRLAVDGEVIAGLRYRGRSGASWLVRSQSPSGIAWRTVKGRLIHVRERVVGDRFLRPISGIPDADTTDEHLTKPVTQPEKEIA